jgi:hypothetical protein
MLPTRLFFANALRAAALTLRAVNALTDFFGLKHVNFSICCALAGLGRWCAAAPRAALRSALGFLVCGPYRPPVTKRRQRSAAVFKREQAAVTKPSLR